MPPLFDDNQKFDESELVDSLAKKAPRSHKAVLIYQGFNPKTRGLKIFVEQYKRAETIDNIARAKFSASNEDSNTKIKKKSLKFKEQDENGKKHHKNNLCFIVLSMVKTKSIPPAIAKSLRQILKTSLSIQQKPTRGSPKK